MGFAEGSSVSHRLRAHFSCFKTNLFASFSCMANTNCTLLILYGYEQERDVAKCLVDDLDIQQCD